MCTEIDAEGVNLTILLPIRVIFWVTVIWGDGAGAGSARDAGSFFLCVAEALVFEVQHDGQCWENSQLDVVNVFERNRCLHWHVFISRLAPPTWQGYSSNMEDSIDLLGLFFSLYCCYQQDMCGLIPLTWDLNHSMTALKMWKGCVSWCRPHHVSWYGTASHGLDKLDNVFNCGIPEAPSLNDHTGERSFSLQVGHHHGLSECWWLRVHILLFHCCVLSQPLPMQQFWHYGQNSNSESHQQIKLGIAALANSAIDCTNYMCL